MKLTSKQLENIKKQFRLTNRQAEVVKALFEGKVTNREIADHLNVKIGSVRQFLYQIHTKMRTESKGNVLVKVLDFLIENKSF